MKHGRTSCGSAPISSGVIRSGRSGIHISIHRISTAYAVRGLRSRKPFARARSVRRAGLHYWLEQLGRLEEVIDFSGYNEANRGGAKYRDNVPFELHQTTWCTKRAIEFMNDDHGCPWLMSLNVFDPHPGYDAPTEYADRYNPDELPEMPFAEADIAHNERLSTHMFQGRPHAPWRRQKEELASYYGTLNMQAPHGDPNTHVPSYATMYRTDRYKLNVYHGNDYGELYDLQADPQELHNLWENPEHQAVKHDLIKMSFDASIVITDPGPRRIGRF